MQEGYWYCKKCMVEVDPIHVTYEELHDECGYPVEWITDVEAGNIFNKLQSEIHISKIIKYIMYLQSFKNNINKFVSNSYIILLFYDIIKAVILEISFPNEFKEKNVFINKYIDIYFLNIEHLSEKEKIKTIESTYQKLREKNNPIKDNLALLRIRLPNIWQILNSN
jgi:hypothetical protein